MHKYLDCSLTSRKRRLGNHSDGQAECGSRSTDKVNFTLLCFCQFFNYQTSNPELRTATTYVLHIKFVSTFYVSHCSSAINCWLDAALSDQLMVAVICPCSMISSSLLLVLMFYNANIICNISDIKRQREKHT